MSLWSPIGNAFRGGLLNCEVIEELESHVAKAIGAAVLPLRRAGIGIPPCGPRKESRDIKLLPWFDSLRADTCLSLALLNYAIVSG